MIRIAICDDDEEICETLSNWTGKICFSKMDYKISCFNDGKEILEQIEQDKFEFDLLILDIHMKHIDGMQVARVIREKRLDIDIIFVTISEKYVYEGYKFKAFSYVLKPISYEVFCDELTRFLDEREEVSDILNITVRGNSIKLFLKDILYFASDKRVIKAISKKEEIVFYEKLDAVYESIKHTGFVRCHQSYIVNIKHIVEFNNSHILLSNGMSIPISRAYAKEISRRLKV